MGGNNKLVFTNNVAEYFALYMAIKAAKKYKADIIYSDSQTIVKQINGLFSVNADNLKVWYEYVIKALSGTDIKVIWISRKIIVKLIGH